ncbi:MAG: type II toxin-antitoxin system RelE/ParE family toxin [Xanthomonadales bacterium]|nr:type II toxin-antitoxin system RelE/ParE family toxin [Xanthomonadales bacterium]
MKARILPAARQDLRDAIERYDQERSGLGREFLSAAREALQRASDFPDAWHPVSPTLRRCRLRRFPYGLIYHTTGSELIVIAVAHLHRMPRYWEGRHQ